MSLSWESSSCQEAGWQYFCMYKWPVGYRCWWSRVQIMKRMNEAVLVYICLDECNLYLVDIGVMERMRKMKILVMNYQVSTVSTVSSMVPFYSSSCRISWSLKCIFILYTTGNNNILWTPSMKLYCHMHNISSISYLVFIIYCYFLMLGDEQVKSINEGRYWNTQSVHWHVLSQLGWRKVWNIWHQPDISTKQALLI